RRAEGLPAVSLAWGFWEQASGMTGHLDRGDRARVARTGILPLSASQGMALFDAAHTVDEALLVAARLDTTTLEAQAASGDLPAICRALVRGRRRMADAGDASAPSRLAQRLAGLSEVERDRVLLEVVLSHTATVLGHTSADAVKSDTGFLEL